MTETINNFPIQTRDEKPLNKETSEEKITFVDELAGTKETEEFKTEKEQEQHLADIASSDQAAIERAMLKIETVYEENNKLLSESLETPIELQEYIDSITGIMEKELEGMNFNRNDEAIEKTEKTRLKKAMLVITAGVMLWISSASAFTETAEAKSTKKNDFSFGEIFNTNVQKTTDGLKKIPRDTAKKAANQATREITKATQKAVNDVLNNIFK